MTGSEILVDVVDEALSRLGEGPKNVIYEALEVDYAIRKEEIPTKFIEFSRALQESLGFAVNPLLQFIIHDFLRKLNREFSESMDLDEAIRMVVDVLHRDNIAEEAVSSCPEKTVRRISEIEYRSDDKTVTCSSLEFSPTNSATTKTLDAPNNSQATRNLSQVLRDLPQKTQN